MVLEAFPRVDLGERHPEGPLGIGPAPNPGEVLPGLQVEEESLGDDASPHGPVRIGETAAILQASLEDAFSNVRLVLLGEAQLGFFYQFPQRCGLEVLVFLDVATR